MDHHVTVGSTQPQARRSWLELLVPLLVLLYVGAYVAQVYTLRIESITYPLLLIGLILLFVAARLIQWHKSMPTGATGSKADEVTGSSIGSSHADTTRRTAALLVVAGLFPWLMDSIGFMLTSFMSVVGLLWLYGERRLPIVITIAGVLSVGLFAIADRTLGIPLPQASIVDLPFGM